MDILFVIIGISVIIVLCVIARNQVDLAKNQVKTYKLLEDIEQNTSRTAKGTEDYNKAYHI